MESPRLTLCLEHPSEFSIPQDNSSFQWFYIDFRYNPVVQAASPTTTTSSSSSFHGTFLVFQDMLRDCDESEVSDPESLTMEYLRDTFSSVPIPSETLDSILVYMGDYARGIIENNHEGHKILGMNVLVRGTTREEEDNSHGQVIDPRNTSVETLLSSLEKVDTTKDDDDSCSSWSCAICLEEFYNVSADETLLRTKCSHVFHLDCIARWLHRCSTKAISYSCPMCRCQISC